ncbi:MAG: hypothetical protein RLZZ505_2245 [Verrucomicrobiota bacterium]|jgi:hypothetical protein
MPEIPKITQASCADCGPCRDHFVLREHKHEEEDQYAQYWTIHQMIECCGCHRIGLKRIRGATFLDENEVDYFPPAVSRKIPSLVEEIFDAPADLNALLYEVYSALNSNNLRLATMGARAVLDVMIVDKVSDVGTFEQKLKALVTEDFITKKQRMFLEAALDAGNAAIHRGHLPTVGDVNRLMNIVEGLLAQIYTLPGDGEELAKSTPQRKRQPKGNAQP